jgi:hypothetical protein
MNLMGLELWFKANPISLKECSMEFMTVGMTQVANMMSRRGKFSN